MHVWYALITPKFYCIWCEMINGLVGWLVLDMRMKCFEISCESGVRNMVGMR